MRRLRIFVFEIVVIGFAAASVQAMSLEALAKKLARGASVLENKKIAVLTLPYHDEKISSASTLLSERLTTCLVERRELRVLERRLIQELLQEKKLGETGVIDPKSLKTIGKMLDAEAIVTGTLIDLPDDTTEINARLIRTDTGEVLAAGQSTVKRTWSDTPVSIVPLVPRVERKQSAPPADTEDSMTEEAAADASPPAKRGKLLKLSNENFPPERRRYLANESHASPQKPTKGFRTVGNNDFQTDFHTDYQPEVQPVVIYRTFNTGHVGYNGTDNAPLPPSSLGATSSSLGTVRSEGTYRGASSPRRSK